MIAPFFIIFLYFWVTPIINVIIDSFTNYKLFGDKNLVWFENYVKLLDDTTFHQAFKNTIFYTVISLVPTMVLGFLFAQFMNNKRIKTRLTRMILFSPHVFSMVAISMIWLLIYDPAYGHANFILKGLGLAPSKWLQDPRVAMIAVAIMSIWKGLGYNMIINLAALNNVSEDYYEVANIEGANYFQRTFYVTIPMMMPTTFFLLITGIIGSFNVFEQVNVLTGGGPGISTTTMAHQIYINGLAHFNMGYASAQSVILILIILTITFLNYRIGGKFSEQY